MARRAHGEGSIRRIVRDNGRVVWEASITLPSRGDGKQRKQRRERRTRALALAALDEMRGDRKDGVSAPAQLTVETWLRRWLQREEDSDKSRGTIDNYRTTLEQHVIPRIGQLKLRELDADHVDGILARMRNAGLGSSYMTRVRNNLALALDEAVARHRVRFNAARLAKIPAPLEERPEDAALRPAQARKLLAAVGRDRLEACWMLMLRRGLRPIEARSLRWRDVDMTAGVLHILTTKSRRGRPVGKSVRDIGLDEQLVEALAAHGARQAIEREQYEQTMGDPWPTDFVFTTTAGTQYNRGIFRRRLLQLFESAGIEGAWHPTDLRRSYASLAKAAGRSEAEIAADLGHKPGSRVTFASYVRDLREVRGLEAGEAIDKLLQKGHG